MKLLIVDDSKTMRLIILRTLRQAGLAGFEYREASNGLEALAALREWPADLVLSDWNMPDRTGLELLEDIRRRGNRVPFGFITSNNIPEMRNQATEAGAAFFLCKPFTVEQFADVVGSFFERA